MNSQTPADIRPGTRILFAAFPADGHFNPLTGLAACLRDAGCDVRWYTSEKYRPKVEGLGLPFYPLKKAFDIGADPDIDRLFPERKKHKGQSARLRFDLEHVFIRRAPEYYEDIQEIYQDFPFELMVADITFGGIPFVKEKMNIPVIAAGIIPLMQTSKDLPPCGLGLMPSGTAFGRLKQSLLRLAADKLVFARPTRILRRLLSGYGIDTGRSNVFDVLISKATIVLQSGTPGFEYARTDMSPHIHFAGPLLPHSRTRSGQRWHHEKLRRYEHVILITQGTVERDVEKLIVPALEAFKDSNCLVIVTTGGSGTAGLRARFPQDNIIIEDFIPFDEVMPHADVYISNGGYGGVLLSIRHGLPMVVGGVHEGKNEINARIGYFGLGVNMRTERPGVLQLRAAVEEVLGDERYAKNVKELAEEFSMYDSEAIIRRHVAALVQRRTRRVRTAAVYELAV